MIKFFKISLLILFIHVSINATAKTKELKVLQFNIWQEGTVIPGGFDAIVEEIIRLKADVITFSEVRNYNQKNFNEKIVKALKNKGFDFYSFYCEDSGILSKYPIESNHTIFPLSNDQGSIYKAIINFHDKKLAVYTAHLDYKHAANYLSRGYHSSTWEKLKQPIFDVDSILKDNDASQRVNAIKNFITDALEEKQKGHIVILGGDFNEPSHLDWTEEGKHLFERHVAVPWTITSLLEKAGFNDAYRKKYPNAISYPGITFPAFNPKVDFKKLIWAQDSDDRDRIDYIFYIPQAHIKLKNIAMIGPKESIEKGKVIVEKTKDNLILPFGTWPTDHRALIATFKIKD